MESRVISVCVSCVGGRLIYDIINALRNDPDFDYFILGVDSTEKPDGRLLADAFEIVPYAEGNETAYMERLFELHEQYNLDAVIPLSEGESRCIASHEELLKEWGLKSSVSSPATVNAMTDKWEMMSRVKAAGLNIGPFHQINSFEDVHKFAGELDYPDAKVVVKPRDGRGSRGVVILDAGCGEFEFLLPHRFCGTGDIEASKTAMDEAGISFANTIAMPHYDGKVYDVDCISRKGEMIACATRLRQLKNPLSPTSTGHKIEMNPDVIEYARELCRIFEADGAADFDVVLDDGGKPLLLDSGSRFSGSVGGSFTAGMNMPAQLIRSILDLPLMELTIEDGTILRPYITMAKIPEQNQFDLM